jgi:hypothetical protein
VTGRRVGASLRALVLIGAVAGAVALIRDLTMAELPRYDHDAMTEIVLGVDGRDYHQSWETGVVALVASCTSSMRASPAGPPERLEERLFRVLLTPAVDAASYPRLRGCLDDATVERLLGQVRSLRSVPASP